MLIPTVPENVGEFENTTLPVPVSSEMRLANCADVVDANCASVDVVRARLDADMTEPESVLVHEVTEPLVVNTLPVLPV